MLGRLVAVERHADARARPHAVGLVRVYNAREAEGVANRLNGGLVPQHPGGPLLPRVRALPALGQVLGDLHRVGAVLAVHLRRDGDELAVIAETVHERDAVVGRVIIRHRHPPVDADDWLDSAAPRREGVDLASNRVQPVLVSHQQEGSELLLGGLVAAAGSPDGLLECGRLHAELGSHRQQDALAVLRGCDLRRHRSYPFVLLV